MALHIIWQQAHKGHYSLFARLSYGVSFVSITKKSYDVVKKFVSIVIKRFDNIWENQICLNRIAFGYGNIKMFMPKLNSLRPRDAYMRQ